MNNRCICWFFTHILTLIHGSRSKISSKKSHQANCAEGFNAGVKGLNNKKKPKKINITYIQTEKRQVASIVGGWRRYFSRCYIRISSTDDYEYF
jgi:hypothetical protein